MTGCTTISRSVQVWGSARLVKQSFVFLGLSKIRKDKSDDTLAYEDSAHKVILRTFSYFLKIVTHIGQEWFISKNYLFQRLERLL